MRYNHSHISLTIDQPLSKEDAKRWRETIELVAPGGVVTSTNIMVAGRNKYSDLYAVRSGNRITYVVPLSRDLLEDEAGKSAIAWSMSWPDGDFEITFSQRTESQNRKSEAISAVLDEISERVAKIQHADWVSKKVSGKWSYGPRYSPSQKKHPMLLPWEQLPDSAKESEITRVKSTLEILDAIDLKITRK